MSEGTKKTVQASKILEEIQRNQYVYYESVVVEGDFDIRKLDLQIRHVERTESQKEIGLTEDVMIVQSEINIINSTFQGELDISNTIFGEGVHFREVTFDKDVLFSGVNFSKDSNFRDTTFSRGAYFNESTFVKEADFSRVKFNCGAYFKGSIFIEKADFSYADFNEDALFNQVFFSGDASFYDAFFSEDVLFNGAKFEGDVLTFRDATFILAKSQEKACRRAKNILAKAGNRDEEEYHFYREMEAKRIRKGIRENSGLGLSYLLLKTYAWSLWNFFLYDVLEWFFIQKIFGYGVRPFRLFGWWLAFVVTFAVIYSIKGAIEQPDARQWYDYLWFSIATASTPGYALYKPLGLFKIIAGVEAILGTFMWAAFITTFARKFSR